MSIFFFNAVFFPILVYKPRRSLKRKTNNVNHLKRKKQVWEKDDLGLSSFC